MPQKLQLFVIRLLTGIKDPDLARALLYRPDFFGKRQRALTQAVMRGPSDWSVGERELMSAFVSRANQCPFCIGVHSAAGEVALGADITKKVLENYRTAPIEEKLRATLAFLEKVTLNHERLDADDARRVLAAGVSREAIIDALYVAFLFNVYNRLVDTLGCELLTPEQYAMLGRGVLKRGYDYEYTRMGPKPLSDNTWLKNSRGEWYVIAQGVLFAALLLAARLDGYISGQITTIVGGFLCAVGLGSIVFGAIGLRRGRSLSPFPKPNEDATLVESGIYSVVRHPIYSGFIFFSFGWSLIWHSIAAFIVAIAFFVFFDAKARREECWLEEKFPGYKAYKSRVRKLIAFVY